MRIGQRTESPAPLRPVREMVERRGLWRMDGSLPYGAS